MRVYQHRNTKRWTQQILDTVGSGTFTVPQGVNTLWVTMAGGGGGGCGGRAHTTTQQQGTGGAGAGAILSRIQLNVNPGDSISYTVASGGIGGTPEYASGGVEQPGSNGGSSIFGLLTAGGGQGGQNAEGGTGGGYSVGTVSRTNTDSYGRGASLTLSTSSSRGGAGGDGLMGGDGGTGGAGGGSVSTSWLVIPDASGAVYYLEQFLDYLNGLTNWYQQASAFLGAGGGGGGDQGDTGAESGGGGGGGGGLGTTAIATDGGAGGSGNSGGQGLAGLGYGAGGGAGATRAGSGAYGGSGGNGAKGAIIIEYEVK